MTCAKILFLNVNLNKKLTGIERASLLRAKLFHEYLNITPIIVTARYSSHYRRNCETHIESGVLHEEIPDINMYEYFQGTDTVLKRKAFVFHPEWTYKQVKSTKDLRVHYNGQLIQYIKRFPNGEIDYINYFSNGKKVRRHRYDMNGYVSLVQHLNQDTQRVEAETFYHVDGNPCLIKHYSYNGKVNQLDSIHLLNDMGEVIEYFENENDFITYFLKELFQENEQYYCFIDKNRTYFHAFMKQQFSNVRVIPCIHAVHTKEYKDVQTSPINSNYKDIFSHFDCIDGMILLTDKQREDIVSRFGEHSSYHVIPHAVEQVPDKVEWEERQPNKVVALGRYSTEKRFNLMIEMFAKVVKQVPHAILEIYGYGSERGNLLKLIQKLEMTNNIFLKDYVDDVSKIYESASLSLLTSQSEGFSLVTMESLAYGCPVISFDIKYGPSDMIKDGKNGFLIEPDCNDVYVEKIIKFLETPRLRKKMSKNAYHMIEPFHANQVAKKWEKLMDDLAFEK